MRVIGKPRSSPCADGLAVASFLCSLVYLFNHQMASILRYRVAYAACSNI
jgi:hypothetical protein